MLADAPSTSSLRFSLVVATLGRTQELSNFLVHLAAQTWRNFELIVVDQNADDRLLPVLAEYSSKFSVLHCRSARGLSRSRNVGIEHATGDVIAFPDDDCWYPPDLLARVSAILSAHPELDGVTGRPIDKSFSRFHTSSGRIDRQNLFLRFSEFTIFLRSGVVRAIGSFNENLGLGSPFGLMSGEGPDYVIRALDAGFHFELRADLEVFHKDPACIYDDAFNRKARGYNFGLGYVLYKHRYPFWYAARTWIRALGGAIVSTASLNCPKARYHLHVLEGRIRGYFYRRDV